MVFNMNDAGSTPSQSQRILRRVARKGRGWAFTPHDFADFGDPRGIGMALTRLVREGKIRRIARGIYDQPQEHPLLGSAGATADSIVAALSRNRNLRLLPSPEIAANQLGLSTQVPARIVYHTDGAPAIVRLGKLEIVFRRNSGRNLALAGRASGLASQAFRALGKGRVNREHLDHLRGRFDAAARKELVQDVNLVPAWMRPLFQELTRNDD